MQIRSRLWQRLDENYISQTFLKSREEQQNFIDEQMAIDPDSMGDVAYARFSTSALREFIGEEMWEATEQPQHECLDERDCALERIVTYYPAIYNAYVLNEEEDPGYFAVYRFADERVAFIESMPSGHIKWLTFLRDNNMTKHDFYVNFEINARRFYDRYMYRLYHTQREVPKRTPNYEEYFWDSYKKKDIYFLWQKHTAMEFVNESYVHSLDMSAGGKKPSRIP